MAQTGPMAVVVPPDAFAVFDRQDSGCVSFGVARGGERVFVKAATTERARRSLRRAIAFHRAVRHPTIVSPLDVVDDGDRTELTYPWRDGVVLNHATVAGSDRSGLAAFHRLPLGEALAALDAILDAHEVVAAAGFVAIDLYDGCFLYDFDAKRMHLIDLDEYRPGPFVLDEDRLPGSTRYMAPEELTRGATIDERTTVFHLGRTIPELAGDSRLTPSQRELVRTATSSDAGSRHATLGALVRAWHAACGPSSTPNR
jgi:serine/threonine-protein kinase